MRSLLLILLCVVPGLPASALRAAAAQDAAARSLADVEAQVRQARDQLRRECLDLAAEATEVGFFSAARDLYLLVVELEPENAIARKGLGMRKRSGTWQARSTRPKQDQVDEEQREPFLRARAALLERAVARVDAAFRDAELTPVLLERRRRELDVLNGVEPDDEELRARTGYAREPDTGAWTLRELVEARARFASNAEALDAIRAALPATSAAELDQFESATRVKFATVIASPALRVAATLSGTEAEELHDLVLTELRYLQQSFGRELRFPLPTSVIALADPGAKQAYFGQHPLVRPAALADHQALYGSWIRQQLVVSSPTAEERKDMGTFLTASAYLGQAFGENGDAGWVRQSLASYLSATVCNTHLSFLVTRDHYGLSDGPPWPERVPPTLDGWLTAARPFLADDKPAATLSRALTVPTRSMTWEDVVVGYAFAAYLFEGRRDDLLVILQRLGRGEDKLGVLESVLELPLPDLRARLAAWIDGIGAID